jgi:hypothetical protein
MVVSQRWCLLKGKSQMAFQNIDNLALGNFLQVSFSQGVRDVLSQYHAEFEVVQSCKMDESNPRELRFLVQTGRGPAAVQYRNPGDNTQAFPAASRNAVSEGTAKTKELDATIEIEYNLWKRAMQSPEKYAEPLAMEMSSKEIAARRRIANDFYGSGSGIVCTSAGSAVDSGSGATFQTVVTINGADASQGGIGSCEYGDILIAKQSDGTTTRASSGGATLGIWKVKDVSRLGQSTSTVTLTPCTSVGVLESSCSASNIVVGDLLFRVGQATFATLASVPDWGIASEVIPGLESLVASDGRTCHALVMSGAFGGTKQDCNAEVLDLRHIQAGMDRVKVRVGQGRYNWKKILMAPEAAAVFVEARETDRRFITIDDNVRGVKKFAYQHWNDSLEFVTSEFCPMNRAYVLPEAKGNERVLQAHISDMETVKAANGDSFHLSPTSGSYYRMMQCFLMGHITLLNLHPAACLMIRNFTLS